MVAEDLPYAPSLSWRIASTATIAFTGFLAKAFARVACATEVHGLDEFLKLLDERKDVDGRQRGLITVSNHVSVLDDPLVWGVLPLRHLCNPDNMRWSLGSYDICFKNRSLSTYFSLGQVLPTHRLAHSPHGGPFQPTLTQCIRLLSKGPFPPPPPPPYTAPLLPRAPEPPDPYFLADSDQAFTTTGSDRFPNPTAHASRHHAWLHVFPEGKVCQHPSYQMRYLKWGIARLILESEPCPDVVPMWIEGLERVMHESRGSPRWWPRWGKRVSVTFGERVREDVWEGFRERWRRLRDREKEKGGRYFGVLGSEGLRTGDEAVRLRMEVTLAVREKLLRLRRARGWPDEDPKAGAVETYRVEGSKRKGRMEDGSWVGAT